MSETSLVTTYNFNGREFLVKMVAADKSLEIVVTDKNSGEEWECSYDSNYVETITQKTGNFKKYSVFVCMLKNGLLKTSECVTLEFLTYEDLQQLRANCLRTHSSRCLRRIKASDRKYLIVNYNVEFDRIHYPLPLDYVGPPDPTILQNTVLRLQKELQKSREELAHKTKTPRDTKKIQKLKDRIEDLISENSVLREEIRVLKQRKGKNSNQKVQTLQKAIVDLEKSVLSERKSHHHLVDKLRCEKTSLLKELRETKLSEQRLKNQLNRNVEFKNSKFLSTNKNGTNSVYTIYRNSANNANQKSAVPRRSRSTPVKTPEKRAKSSRSSSVSKYSNSSVNDDTKPTRKQFLRNCRKQLTSSSNSRDSSVNSNSSRRTIRQEIDFDVLQKKIESLQNMLEGHV